jgi:hypothetical protein
MSLAIIATMAVTYLSLVYSKGILQKGGPKGIDAATRIVGFFVSAMGMGFVFHGGGGISAIVWDHWRSSRRSLRPDRCRNGGTDRKADALQVLQELLGRGDVVTGLLRPLRPVSREYPG